MRSKKRLQWKTFDIHSVTYQESESNVNVLNKSVNDGENPTCVEMVDAGVDWMPRTFLDALVEKALGLWLNSLEILLSLHRIQTQESRILLFFASGRVKCNNYSGNSSLAVRAHVVAACMKTNRTKNFLHWVVRSKRAKACTSINLSKAVTLVCLKDKAEREKKRRERKAKTRSKPR